MGGGGAEKGEKGWEAKIFFLTTVKECAAELGYTLIGSRKVKEESDLKSV